jgi:peptidylprolyl isomerase
MTGKIKLGIGIIVVLGIAAAAGFYVKNNSMAPTEPVATDTTDTSNTNNETSTTAPQGETKMPNYDLTPDADGLSKAVATMTLEKGGVVKWKFFTNDAPNTVKRISQLVSEGFYNGIVFHRVVSGFVVQAGDPTGTGAGGSGTKLKAEFNKNKHVPGIVSMARTQDPNSADSQFYIMLGTHPHLDGQYTVFAKVIEGYENVESIRQGDKIKSISIE